MNVKCYYVFNEEVIPTLMEATCLCDDLVLSRTLQHRQGFEAHSAFWPHQEADLGRRGLSSCWFSYCCGTGASHLTLCSVPGAALLPDPGQERSKAGSHPERRNVAATL